MRERFALFPQSPPLCDVCRRRLSPRNGRRSAHRHCREARRRKCEPDWRREMLDEAAFFKQDRDADILEDFAAIQMLEEAEHDYQEYQQSQRVPDSYWDDMDDEIFADYDDYDRHPPYRVYHYFIDDYDEFKTLPVRQRPPRFQQED